MASRRRNAKAAPKKAAKSAKPKKASAKKPKAAKEPKEVAPGPPTEIVAVIITGIMLLAAVVLVDYAKGKNYGSGMFFADSYESES